MHFSLCTSRKLNFTKIYSMFITLTSPTLRVIDKALAVLSKCSGCG